ncbi:golgin-45 isoform X2 [Vespula pensylvanica]|uniref:golgin-45 isoform X2 n=1 Tax=Vespula pensylvanica TaxID=30213 RepID=UPI001CBA53AE|nr:golgin-45 isoform X2 [Vespula pensylvanica]
MAGIAENHKSNCQLKAKDVQIMDCIGRTQGDGMENVVMIENEVKQSKCRLNDSLIYYPKNLKQSVLTPPVTPTGTIVNLIPKNITKAVNPIVPVEKKNKKHSKWDTSINVAATDVAKLKINDVNIEKERSNEKGEKEESNWNKEKKIYETEIQKLKEENSQLENQLKFQAQVNGELKNLLVAAVGEDLETKVHLLTEDKLQLARALLNSAQHLSTHQEQTEWLAGQCEVWRSKFLASSLMVEELARWKAALRQRTTDLQESIKRLLEERKNIRDASLKTYRTLSILLESFDPVRAASYKRHALPSTNVIDLAQGCCQLAEILKVQLLSGMLNTISNKDINITGLEMQTLAEKNAEQLLMSPNLLMSGRQDAACSAVMGAAFAIGGQIFIPREPSNISCCPNCSGEINQI